MTAPGPLHGLREVEAGHLCRPDDVDTPDQLEMP